VGDEREGRGVVREGRGAADALQEYDNSPDGIEGGGSSVFLD